MKSPSSAFAAATLYLAAVPVAGIAAPAAPPVATANADTLQPPIPIRFTLDKPGNVTLVIEDEKGNRVRNLIAATPFPAGKNVVWWDGRDESVRVPYVEGNTVGIHGIYRVAGRPVTPGKYTVRGLVRDDVKLRYDFTVYPSNGNPPWRTADGTGAWLSDHTPPADTEFVPATAGLTTEDRVYISATVAEAGLGLIWTDLNGRKLNGVRWIGGHWTGAGYLARDAGTQPVPQTILYTASGWSNDKDKITPELRLNAMTPNGAREIFTWRPKAEDGVPQGAGAAKRVGASVTGLAARNGLLVAGEGVTEKLIFVRVSPHPKNKNNFQGELLATAPFKGMRDLAFDANGRLLVLTAQGLRRYTLPAEVKGNVELGAGEAVIGAGLEDARRLSLDAAGRIYVSDWGKSHQVKVFEASGKPVRTVGSAGEPVAGPYQPGHMNRPLGTTVLPDGRLWVAEDDFAPKRVSVWDAGGKLVRDMIGPPPYGGGGWLDPADKTKFYLFHGQGTQGGGMEFKLDWEQGKATLSNVYLRNADSADFRSGFWGDGPDSPIIIQGRRYLTNAFSSSPTNGARVYSLWRMGDNGLVVPVFAAGAPQSLPAALREQLGDTLPADARPKPKGDTPYLFTWSDANANGKMENAEFRFAPLPNRMSSVAPTREGAFVATLSDRILSFAPTWQKDVPSYDLGAPVTLAANFKGSGSSGGGQSVIGKNGWTVLTSGPIQGFQNGESRWYYHNQWPGLHAGHRAPAQLEYTGQIVAATRLLGLPITPRGEGGEMWSVNSDRAVMYLMTTDGLFVAQLGDVDTAKQWRDPRFERNMDISGVNFVGENFWPSLTQTSDGNVYLVTGKEHSSLIRVDGLDSIKRLAPQTLDVTPALLAQAETYFQKSAEAAAAKAVKEPLQVVLRTDAMKVDGDLADWKGAKWAVIDPGSGQGSKAQRKLPAIEGAVAVSGDNLLVALRSRTPNLLRNEAQTPQELFKTGGGLDVMLGSGGDKRVLLALSADGKKTLGAIYQPVVPGTKPENRVPFSSPWRTIHFDRVEDVATRVQLKTKLVQEKDADGESMQIEQIEAAIPLALLELSPKPGQTVRGDLGVLRGAGGETLQRLYWSNKATGLMNDVPGEAQLTPGAWGQWEFVAEP